MIGGCLLFARDLREHNENAAKRLNPTGFDPGLSGIVCI